MKRSILIDILDRPEDIGRQEYRVIHAELQRLALERSGPAATLEALILACDEFICWAEHAKSRLMDIRPARPPAKSRGSRRELRVPPTRAADTGS